LIRERSTGQPRAVSVSNIGDKLVGRPADWPSVVET
jgi:hypothetical protein